MNGRIFSAVAAFNAPVLTPEHAALVGQVPQLFARLGWESKFPAGELTRERADLMVKASMGHPFRLNNARETTDADIYDILRAAGADC